MCLLASTGPLQYNRGEAATSMQLYSPFGFLAALSVLLEYGCKSALVVVQHYTHHPRKPLAGEVDNRVGWSRRVVHRRGEWSV